MLAFLFVYCCCCLETVCLFSSLWSLLFHFLYLKRSEVRKYFCSVHVFLLLDLLVGDARWSIIGAVNWNAIKSSRSSYFSWFVVQFLKKMCLRVMKGQLWSVPFWSSLWHHEEVSGVHDLMCVAPWANLFLLLVDKKWTQSEARKYFCCININRITWETCQWKPVHIFNIFRPVRIFTRDPL